MLMSKSAYAKHRGVSRQTVYAWIEKGEVVLSGSKIDVDATDSLQNGNTHNASQQEEPVLEITWGQLWEAVKASDGKLPQPVTEEQIQHCVNLAARAIGYSVEYLEDNGIYLHDFDAEHYFQGGQLVQNADLAIDLLRKTLCYAADECPDEPGDWTQAEVESLSQWRRED